MQIIYGLAEFDRFTGMVGSNINLPMDGVVGGTLYEFLHSAGENGWELCAAFPSGMKGIKRPLTNPLNTRTCEDAAEEIAFIFKKVE